MARGTAAGPRAVLAYLIRRLFAAAVMLVVIILVVFCIFFLVPRWAGVDPATMFVGKQADPAAVEAVRQKLGLADPIFVQVWEFFKGTLRRAYLRGRRRRHGVRGALLRLLLPQRAGHLAGAHRPLPSDPGSRARCRHPVAGLRCRGGCALRAQARVPLGPWRDDRRPRRRLAPHLLHRSAVAGDLQLRTGLDRRPVRAPRGELHRLVRRHDPALGHAGLPLRGDVRPDHQSHHAGGPGRGLHPHRPRQGPDANPSSSASTRCGPP